MIYIVEEASQLGCKGVGGREAPHAQYWNCTPGAALLFLSWP